MRKETGKNTRFSENNRGITLIEVLVSVAIVGVVLAAVAGFYITSLTVYQRVTRESDLQNEAQLAFTQIQSLAVNASNGVGLGTGVTGTTGNDLYIYDHVDTTCEITHIYQEGNELYFCKISYAEDANGDPVLGPDKQDAVPFAEYVDHFMVDMSNFTKTNSIDIAIDFVNRDRTYSSKNTIYMRNQLVKKVSGSAKDYFGSSVARDNAATVTNFRLTPTVVYLWPNDTTYNAVTPEVSRDGGLTYTSASRVIWSVDSSQMQVSVNRNNGAITIKDAPAGSGGTITATVSTGNTAQKTMEASANYYTKAYNSLSMSEVQPVSETDHKNYTATLTAEGNYLQPDSDMAVSPVVLSGSTVDASFVRDTSSSTGYLRWKVQIKRPADYKGNTYTLKIGLTLHNKQLIVTRDQIVFTAADNEKGKTIEKVRLVENNQTYDATGIISVDASRGSTKSFVMQAKYKEDNDWITLDADEWSITPDNSSVTARAGSGGYSLAMAVKDYTKTVVVNCTTRYFRGDQSGNGPTLQLKFNPVTIALDNGAPTTQKSYPVTCGTTEQMTFAIRNLEGASVVLLDKSDAQAASSMRVSVNGKSASVTVAANTAQKKTFYFGVRTSDGTELPSTISCEVGMIPGTANLYRDTSMAKTENTFVPLVNSNFRQYDSTKSAPTGNGTVQLYTLSKGAITYSATSAACMYKISFNGTTYKFANPEHRISGWIKN